MSRYRDWQNALTGISHFIKSAGIKVNERNFFVENIIVIKYCKTQKFKGSLTEMYLYVGKSFQAFKKHVRETIVYNTDLLTSK